MAGRDTTTSRVDRAADSSADPDVTGSGGQRPAEALFATAPDWGHRPALDGIRAVAVYLVLAFHAGVVALRGGFIGVDVFFVLSGFLMTSVLLTEIDGRGRLRLGRFYARRMRRLAPAAIVVVLVTAAAITLVMPFAERLRLVDDARYSLVYLANWNLIGSATDYFAAEDAPSPYLHFWSLSLEEQYYVFFPLLLIGIVWLTRRFSRTWIIPAVLGGLGLLSLAAQIYWNSKNPVRAYYGTDARLYQILAGAVLASLFLIRKPVLRSAQVAAAAAVAALIGLIVFATDLFDVSPSVRGIIATVLSITLVIGLELGGRSLLTRVLETKAMTYLGMISYGTYLWHWPVIVIIRRVLDIDSWTMLAVATPVATGLAALSYQLLESPIRRTPRLDRFPRTVALAGLAVTVIIAAVVVAPMLRSTAKPALIQAAPIVLDGDADLGAEVVPAGINYRKLAGDRPPFPACGVADLDACTIRTGTGPHVLLVGDSHARMLIPALESAAEANDLTLSVNVTPSCPWQIGVTNTLRPAAEQRTCVRQREAWYLDALPELDPDVIVFAALARDGEGSTNASMVPLDDSLADLSLVDLTDQLTRSTIELIGADRRIVIVEPVPAADFNPLDCLSGADLVADCAFIAPEGPPSETGYRTVADEFDNVDTVDLDPLACPDLPVCLPVVDDIVVRRDGSHFTTAFAASIADELWDRIADTT